MFHFHPATVNVQVNGYSPQSYAAPPSPLSRFPQATSPGPMAHDLTSYITSANDTALGFSSSSPQATSFGHPMAVSRIINSFLPKVSPLTSRNVWR